MSLKLKDIQKVKCDQDHVNIKTLMMALTGPRKTGGIKEKEEGGGEQREGSSRRGSWCQWWQTWRAFQIRPIRRRKNWQL